MKSNYWCKAEIENLRKLFDRPFLNVESMLMMDKSIPNKTTDQKLRKAETLRLINKKWTEYEDRILHQFYPAMGAKICYEIINYRTPSDIRKRATKKLGLSAPKQSNYKRKGSWYEWEEQLLIDHGNKTLNELSNIIERKGPHAISKKRRELQNKLLHTPEIWVQPDQIININNLPNDTYQILLGSILAFHDISSISVNTGFHGTISKRLQKFTHWTANNLGQFMPHIDIKTYPIMESFNRFPLQHISKAFDIDRLTEGCMPFNHLKKIDEIGLFIWYLNKGSSNLMKCAKGYNAYPTIRTDRYNPAEVCEAVELINKRMGVSMKAYFGANNSKKKVNRIHLHNKARNKFSPTWNKVYELLQVPECINYKLFTVTEELTEDAPRWWSTKEEQILMDNFTRPINEVIKLLPNRDKRNIIDKKMKIAKGGELNGVRAINR